MKISSHVLRPPIRKVGRGLKRLDIFAFRILNVFFFLNSYWHFPLVFSRLTHEIKSKPLFRKKTSPWTLCLMNDRLVMRQCFSTHTRRTSRKWTPFFTKTFLRLGSREWEWKGSSYVFLCTVQFVIQTLALKGAIGLEKQVFKSTERYSIIFEQSLKPYTPRVWFDLILLTHAKDKKACENLKKTFFHPFAQTEFCCSIPGHENWRDIIKTELTRRQSPNGTFLYGNTPKYIMDLSKWGCTEFWLRVADWVLVIQKSGRRKRDWQTKKWGRP